MTPTNKQELVNEISNAHQDLVRMLASMSDEERVAPILQDGWSVKDSLAHIVAWEKMTLDWLARSLQGEYVKRYIPGFIYGPPEEQERVMEALNQQLFEQNRQRALDDVMRDFRATHRTMLGFVESMNESDIFDPERFAWREGSPALDLIAGNTYEHYAEHQSWILDWRDNPREDSPVANGNGEPAQIGLAESAHAGMGEPTQNESVEPAQIETENTVSAPPSEVEELTSLLSTPNAAKDELLRRIHTRHAEMAQLLSSLTMNQMTAPLLDGGWSVKDSLAHLVAWETLLFDWVGKYKRGEDVVRWAPGFEIVGDNGEEQMNRFNDYLFEQNKARPLEQVLDDFRSAFSIVVQTVEGLSEPEIFDPDYFAVRDGRPLITLLVGDTYEHYDEHLTIIRRAFT